MKIRRCTLCALVPVTIIACHTGQHWTLLYLLMALPLLSIATSNCISAINSCFQAVPLHRLKANGPAFPNARGRHTGQGWAFDEPLLPLKGMHSLTTTGCHINFKMMIKLLCIYS